MWRDKLLHDLASPIGGVEMLLDSLLEDLPEGADPQAIRERVAEAMKGVERIKEILDGAKGAGDGGANGR